MNPHSKALDSMIGDMDDMETKKMFPEEENKGVSITISVTPNGEMEVGEGMNKGGMADCYSEGGTVPKPELEADIFNKHGNPDPEYKKGEMGMSEGGLVNPEAEEDMSLPPFLRKKKKGLDQ